MPLQMCFIISSLKESKLHKELMQKGATHDEAVQMIRQLRYCGKAVFTGFKEEQGEKKKQMAVEMLGRNLWEITEVEDPADVTQSFTSPRSRRGSRR